MKKKNKTISFMSIATKSLVAACFLATLFIPVVSAFNSNTPISRITTDSNGNQQDMSFGSPPTMSADGRYVAFRSTATNLVPNDTNGFVDMFVKDTVTGVTSIVSTSTAGVQGNASVTNVSPSISADGRYVAFLSPATNMIVGDTNGFGDVFVKDRQTGTTTRVSTSSAGVQSTGTVASGIPPMSSDGRYVAFKSNANNMVAGDTNGVADAFLKDTQTGTTTRVSTDSAGAQGNGGVTANLSISADGRYVAFVSLATNMVGSDTNGVEDVFVKDTQTGTTTRVSTDSAGAQGNGTSKNAYISPDGMYVTFHSAADNLVGGDTNGFEDDFVKNLITGVTTRINTASDGTQANNEFTASAPSLSGDGRYVTFATAASNMVSDDTNNLEDFFIKDTQTNQTVRISSNSDGQQGDGAIATGTAVLSSDGNYIAFGSSATNLVAGDTNGLQDLFYRQNPFTAATPLVPSTTTPGVPNTGLSTNKTPYIAYGFIASTVIISTIVVVFRKRI